MFQSMLDAAANARTVAARGDKPPVLTLFPDAIEQARALGGEHGAEGFEYYRTPRAQHPRSASFLDWTSIDKMATFDAFALIPLIGQRPLLMIVGYCRPRVALGQRGRKSSSTSFTCSGASSCIQWPGPLRRS